MSDDTKKNLPAPVRIPTGQFPAILTPSRRPSGTNMPIVRANEIDVLARDGLVKPHQVQRLRDLLSMGQQSLDAALEEIGFTPDQLVDYRAAKYNIPSVTLSPHHPAPDVLELLPFDKAEKYGVIPLSRTDRTLTVVIADPGRLDHLDMIARITNLKVSPVVAAESSINVARKRYYGNTRGIELTEALDRHVQDISADDVSVVPEGTAVIDVDALEKSSEEDSIVKLVNLVLVTAIQRGASDIHVESYEKMFRIRFRIDGTLYEIQRPPRKLRDAIVSRIKIMASLDIAERRAPQDGRIKLRLPGGRDCDFRVSVLPSLFGEKVVLRLLDRQNLQTDMTKLGFDADELTRFKAAIHKPYGMVLVTGPTGSGKTTTLYSALHELNRVADNVSTVEDPVEYNLEVINQFQMRDGSEMTFANALRALLRQDPDIIMVGEIRDFETAEIAIKAALTGHMVLSTLHTNSAPLTIGRLLNMGVEPFMVTASVNLIAAQRLVRRVCDQCKQLTQPEGKACMDAGMSEAEIRNGTFYEGAGCPTCNQTGFKGRVAIYEIMPMTAALKEAVMQGCSPVELEQIAVREGMQTLRRSALKKFALGLTTLAEVLRVTRED
ncbi:MAG: type IV-A pilus assembly ATPase PilB [Candidatus Uhrbacteria bacterium]|nr:type IV-A pilus assembly ATPase PilB [Candidatus Uhrbacteria bacterium]